MGVLWTWKTWYENSSFRKKVLYSFLLVSLVPVTVLGAFSYIQTRNILVRREKEVVQETLKQSVLSLGYTLNAYKNIMDNITWDSTIRQALIQRYSDNYEMYLAYRDVIDPTFFRITNLNPLVRQITVYSENPTLNPHGNALRPMEEIPVTFDDYDYQIHWVFRENESLDMYCRIYTEGYEEDYREGGREKNIVYLSLDYGGTFSGLSSLFGEDYGVLVLDEEGSTVFSCDTFGESGEEYRLMAADVWDGKGSGYVLQQENLPVNGWTVYLYRPLAVISASAMSIPFLVAVMVMICVAVVLVASFALTDNVVRRLEKLIKYIDAVEAGDLTAAVADGGKDEIGVLMRRFGEMVERLNHMVKEVYESRIAQQQYEVRALQAQINPHFLYNSLSLINWKAIMAGEEEISEMTQLLSTFYRTTLNKGKNVTRVKDEWDNTCSYARIQNMLHSGKINMRMEIDETILEYEILNLLLQPLVENAVVHGLDHRTEPGEKCLCVRGKQTETDLVFTVEDNGCGIAAKVLESILTIDSNGYGIQNVHHRVQLYYGEQYGLMYESREGEGTRATLRVPKRMRQQEESQ
ncbi:MAG: sensor histidine kinase [Clostridiales bacterium]|nr:sensor histidine kinase [Clostridiales bacterium]